MGMCFDGPDGLLVISGSQVMRLDIKAGICKPIVRQGLAAPFDVAVDKNGLVLVTDRGTAQQIKRFDRQGKPRGSFGVPGGRDNNGRFDVTRLRNPAGITVAASGKIFYSEDAEPKIFVRLGADLTYEKLWSGPWYVSGEVCVDPAQPEDMYTKGGPSFIRHKLDYTARTSRPDAVWTDFALPGEDPVRWWTSYGRWFPRIVHHDGIKIPFLRRPGGQSVPYRWRYDADRRLAGRR